MYVLAELGYALIFQAEELNKSVVFKMLLQRRAKAQQEVKSWLSRRIYLFSVSLSKFHNRNNRKR